MLRFFPNAVSIQYHFKKKSFLRRNAGDPAGGKASTFYRDRRLRHERASPGAAADGLPGNRFRYPRLGAGPAAGCPGCRD